MRLQSGLQGYACFVSPAVGRNDPCPCGSRAKYKRCCLDRDKRGRARPSEAAESPTHAGAEHDPASSELTLFIETATGVMIRRVPNASPLRSVSEQGLAAEEATHDAAAIWSVPDFVYRSTVRKTATASRELGDGFLIVGELGIVVQVKSRKALTSDPAKERRWIEKQVSKALRQANGTIRSLQREPALLTNARGREIQIDGNDLRWIVAVVIDHPDAPDHVGLGDISSPTASVILLRRDWEFLFNQLKSVHAVGGYFERVAGDAIELGEEPMRYYDLASADEQTAPGPIDPAIAALGARQVSMPLLPMAPAAHEDSEAHFVVRMLFEDIATAPIRAGEMSEARRLKVLAELDRLPVGHREEMGRFLLEGLEKVEATSPEGLEWRLRRYMGPRGEAHLAFGVCSEYSPMIETAFGAWVQLRHDELHSIVDQAEELTTVGVLLTPRHDGKRPWDTSMVTTFGDLELTDEEIANYRSVWKSQDDATLRTV